MRKSLLSAILLAVCGHAAAAGYDEDVYKRLRIEADRSSLMNAPTAAPPNTCSAAPLPLTAMGPTAHKVFTTYDGSFDATAWRLPCSASESMVVLTLKPLAGTTPFICSLDFTLIQSGGLQTGNIYANPDPSTVDSFCGDLLVPITVGIYPKSNFPANFDLDQGMTIDFDGGSSGGGHQQLVMFAFDPSQYSLSPPNGPNTVKVLLRGAAIQYRNCNVTPSPIGGGTQYSATCGSETPLKSGGFDRYDY